MDQEVVRPKVVIVGGMHQSFVDVFVSDNIILGTRLDSLFSLSLSLRNQTFGGLFRR